MISQHGGYYILLSTTGPMSTSQVQLAYSGTVLGSVLCVSPVSESFSSANRPACLLLYVLVISLLTVQLVVPRQPPVSNVADSDILLSSVLCFLPDRSGDCPTTRPFGPALQALNFCGLHSVTRIHFFPCDIVSASTPSSCLSSRPSTQRLRPS